MARLSSNAPNPRLSAATKPRRTGRAGRWLRNLRISRKLAVIIVVHLLHATILLALTFYGLKTVDASRAYVEGEGLWSKAQKNGFLQLLAFSETGDEAEYHAFLKEMEVILGDRAAREELEKDSPDMRVVRRGFEQGGNHPDDIDNMAWLFRTFRAERHMDRAIAIWAAADENITLMLVVAEDLRHERLAVDPDPVRLKASIERVREANVVLTVLEQDFSSTLGEGARFISLVVTAGTIGLTVVFVGGALLVSAAVARQVAQAMQELKAGAERMAEGQAHVRVAALGRDEVADVGRAFNEMAQRLAQAETDRKASAQAQKEAEGRMAEMDHLKQVNLFKTQFINTAAHELRTPLAPLRIQLHLVLNDTKEPLTAHQRRALDLMKRNVDRLGTLVEDLLTVARGQAGRLGMEPQSIVVGPLVAEAAASYQALAAENGVTLTAAKNVDAKIVADPTRLTQVLMNLLSNAIKFTPRGGSVRVDIDDQAAHVRVRVTDSGIGIEKAALSRLFSPFVQVHDTTQVTQAGSGLGLYICKQLVEMHGGTIGVESTGRGKGSTFWFRLPKQPPLALVPGTVSEAEPKKQDAEANGSR